MLHAAYFKLLHKNWNEFFAIFGHKMHEEFDFSSQKVRFSSKAAFTKYLK